MINASKHFDPQLGVDIHTYAVPPGPLPTPHISMVLDVWDYLPIIGATTKVHGLKRSVAGTEGKVIHIPIGTWAPPLKVPMGPQSDDELFMGSKTVRIDGDPFSRRFMPTLSCNIVGMPSPFRPRQAARPPAKSLNLPLTANIALPHDVYVGGPPTISIMAMLMKVGLGALKRVGKTKRFQSLMEKFKNYRVKKFENMKPGFLKCKILRAEPVDIRTGSVRVEQLDFSLPGRLPLIWARYYSSNNIDQQGVCGYGWRTLADTILIYHQDKDYWQLELAEGPFYFSETPEKAGRENAVCGLPIGRLWFEQDEKNIYWLIETDEKIIYRFTDNGKNNLPNAQLAIAAIEDRNGNQWAFEYQKGQLTRLIEKTTAGATGREIHITGEDNRIWQMRLFYAAEHSYSDLTGYGYDKDNQLIAQLDNLGKTRQYNYQNNYMTYHQDRLGQKFYYDYNADKKVIHAWGDGGLYDYQFNWIDEYHELEMIDSLGYTSIIRFSEDNLPLCEIDPEKGTTFFCYDEFGRTVQVISPSGKKTRWEYDDQGNICSEILADDTSIKIDYQDNLPVKVIDQAGQVWQHEFDNKGNVIKITDPTKVFTEYQYDALGQLNQIKQQNGACYIFAYNPLGFIRERTDPTKQQTFYQYDVRGNLLEERNPLNQITSYRYDMKDRLINVINSAKKQITIQYDAEDQPIEYIDEAGNITHLTYNGTGEVTGCQTPDGQWVNYQYDTEDQLIAVQNQLKQQWQLKRDGLGRIIEEIDYWGQSTYYQYDTDNNVIVKTDPLGTTLNYHYDPLGRLTEKYHKTTLLVQYRYDARGLMTQCDNPWRKLAWSYDPAGRLISEYQDGFTIKHNYNKLGQYIGRTSDTGNSVTLTYNSAGQLNQIQLNQLTPIQLEYDALGRVKQEHLSETISREINYNNQGQITAQRILNDTQPLFDTHYHYDATGNLLERSDSLWGLDQYNYDSTGKLIGHIDPLGKIREFIFDVAGNRIQDRIQQGTNPEDWQRIGRIDSYTYIYDKAGQLKQRSNSIQPNNPQYFEWNESQQLIAVHQGEQHTYYGYDGLGRRIYKQQTDTTHWYFWDGDIFLAETEQPFKDDLEDAITIPQPINKLGSEVKRQEQLRELFGQLREYIYYPNTFWPLAMLERKQSIEKAELYYYYCDINGAPTRLIDKTGKIVWSEQLGVWGEKGIVHANEINNPIRFQGQYYDQETGLHYNRFRYYDPDSGCYITQDPIGLIGGINCYLFTPDVWYWRDPLGLANTTSQNAAELAKNMAREGRAVSSDQAAGHIVASTGSKGHWESAKKSRDLLDTYDIGINDAANGIAVGHPRPHNEMHTRVFHDKVFNTLKRVETNMIQQGYGKRSIRRALRRTLRKIGKGCNV